LRDIDIRIPLYEPSLGEEELANVVTAVRSGWVSSLGSFVPEFEREFAAFCGRAVRDRRLQRHGRAAPGAARCRRG